MRERLYIINGIYANEHEISRWLYLVTLTRLRACFRNAEDVERFSEYKTTKMMMKR